MTLLEAMVALVILALSAVGYLEVFRAGASAGRDADEWTRTVAIAESAMEAATLGDARQAQDAVGAPAAGFRQQLEVRRWRSGIREVVVTVTSPRGVSFTLHRLARDR